MREEYKTFDSYGFVTPYNGQTVILNQELKNLDSEAKFDIDTVDAWQGREKPVIVFSAVRSNKGGTVGFLENLRRMNVALSRA